MKRTLRTRHHRVGVSLLVAATLTTLSACGSTDATANPATTTAVPTTTSVASSTSPPTSVTSTTVAPYVPPRVLLIGDSTLLAVDRYDGFRALRGFDYLYDAESCRTLGIPSCGDPPIPPNAVEAIGAANGGFDYVVIMAGYDEWWTSFPDSFDEVVAASRAKGAHTILWLTYPEGVPYKLLTGERADEAFIKNNQTLRDKVATGQFPDVLLAKWYPHVRQNSGWITDDGIHLSLEGALGVSDYISRWVAHSEGVPCPMPSVLGGPIEPVCSNPDTQPQIADVISLYES